VGRPAKTLDEHVREGSFRARTHHELLAGAFCESVRLRVIQASYQAAPTERERRSHALDFEKESRREAALVGKAAPLERLGVAEFFETHFVHPRGSKIGQPFVLEEWQREFVDELYRVDEEGRRIYNFALLLVPRGNGKSPLAAGLGLYELMTREDNPDVFIAAAARDQAGVVFGFCRDFGERGSLAPYLTFGRKQIARRDGLGGLRTVSADGAVNMGHSVAVALIDEHHAFTTPKQEEVFTALQSATSTKRVDAYTLVISTTGWDKETQLGELYDRLHERLELEHPRAGLTVGRDEENGVLLWEFGAPVDADIDDEAVWRAANPAGWLDLRELRRQRHSPAVTEAAFRRLHLNQWTEHEAEPWITRELWEACRSGLEIPASVGTMSDGTARLPYVNVAVDAAWSNDSTAVVCAWAAPDGRVVLRAHVWATRSEVVAHEHLSGPHMNLSLVEEYILGLQERYSVLGVTFDPAYFNRSAENLSAAGLVVSPLQPSSEAMRLAYSQFHQAVIDQRVAHDGDPVLASHVHAAVAELDQAGHWKVRKRQQRAKIDALVAAVMVYSKTALETAGGGGLVFA
jgi:phage terminase large subunit-like protein